MAAVTLLWLVFVISFLTHLRAQRLSYPMEQMPITEADIRAVHTKADIPPGGITGIFPPKFQLIPTVPAPDESNIIEIEAWNRSNTAALVYAKGELEKLDPTPEDVDWSVALYQLIVAYIVNFRDADDTSGGLPISDRWITRAANVLELQYIAFTDLSWVSIPGHIYSGPFCGVFVSNDSNPFMILSFKGTSNPLEAATNGMVVPTTPSDGTLYNQSVHKGMYDGLFKTFSPTMEEPAIDVIWSELQRVATTLGGSVTNPVPLYVSGHSLGGGYAQLAYVELFRRLDKPDVGRAFRLKSLYAFGAPRVAAILGTGFANKVHEVFEERKKPIFRFSNEHDVVPFAPGIITLRGASGQPDDNILGSGWIHLDGGYILDREEPPYYTPDTTERFGLPKGDPDGHSSWDHHFPDQYYNSIKKIVDYSSDAI